MGNPAGSQRPAARGLTGGASTRASSLALPERWNDTGLSDTNGGNGGGRSTPAGAEPKMERLSSLERLSRVRHVEELGRCMVKMPVKEAAALRSVGLASSRSSPTAAAGIADNNDRFGTGSRIQIPKGNNEAMNKLLQALKVANDLHKGGSLSDTAYQEMCIGIQEQMDSLVCLWVPPSTR